MDRFSSLDIANTTHPTLTTLFVYEDQFIDQGLRLYDFKQAFHLYLKKQGYKTIVFYNTASGYSSYEKDMLINFLSPVTVEQEHCDVNQNITLDIEQVGRRSKSRLGARMRKKTAGASLIPESSVPVSAPQLNLWFDANKQRWHRKSIGDRIANMDQILYNLPARRHMAIIIDASDQEPEFTTGVDTLVEVIKETQQKATINKLDINDNRLIILVNSQSCRLQMMRLFVNEHNQDVQHKSIFMNGYFRTNMLTMKNASEHYSLNLRTSFPIGQPTKHDIRQIILRARLDSGVEKTVDWIALEDICEQLSFKDDLTLNSLYNLLLQKSEYTYGTFKVAGVKKRGDAEQELNNMIGLQSVKDQIKAFKNRLQLAIDRGEDISSMNKHMVFYGNPGTGKTTVARIIARIYKDLGFVSKGHLVEVSRENLVAGYVGQTAIKTQKVIDSAMDGILFVDEAYQLARGGENDFGQEAIDTILARMENDRDRLVVILAGYPDDMGKLFQLNDGLKSRINHEISFDDYNTEELKNIFLLYARKKYTVSVEVESLLDRLMKYALGYKSRSNDTNYKFGNGRWVRNLFEKVEDNVSARSGNSDVSILLPNDFEGLSISELQGFSLLEETETAEKSNLEKLMSMTGLRQMKEDVQMLISNARYIQQCKEAGIELSNDTKPSMHMVFSGNPGTGKTTVARLMGQIYYDLGLLSNGNVVEIQNRGMLVAGYSGQTAINVNKVVDSARGGVLFIDEIYSLVEGSQDSFGKEALNTLLTRIENERDNMVVILAGYEELMSGFFKNNPGLQSRFNKYIHFEDYTANELLIIFENILLGKKKEFILLDDARAYITEFISQSKETMTKTSGNGRWARNLADKIKGAHQNRLAKSPSNSRESLLTYTMEDVQSGIQIFKQNQL